MKYIFLLQLFLGCLLTAHAGKITGTIQDTNKNLLPYASISVKGTSKGAVANSQGRYQLTLDPGTYTLVCQYVGFKASEKTVVVSEEAVTVDFMLTEQELTMQEVVIKRGEDPAIAIMRETIRKRDHYNKQVDSLTVDVYVKGLMRSRGIPKSFMGQKIETEDLAKDGIDSAGNGILFLSESLTRLSYKEPNKVKYEVVSSRQSGGGYGLSFPFFINFYTNNVAVFSNRLNPRGFVSPVADNAFHFYNFKYEGNYFEGDKMIDRIRVTPKRRFEPLFTGYLQIIDGEWRIHSLDLKTTSDYQLEILDTIRITQMHAAVTPDIWRVKNQVLYVAVKKFGFDITGSFLNVYTNYNLTPAFSKKFFNRVIMRYDTAFNKKDTGYWNNVRPVALEADEKRDFKFKDSVSKADHDSMFTRSRIDSLRKKQKPIELKHLFFGGINRTKYTSRVYTTYSMQPLVRNLEYNTVEGLAINVIQSLNMRPKEGGNNYNLGVHARYGVSNRHFNLFGTLTIRPKTDDFRNVYLMLSGGKRVSQINHDNPIHPLVNTFYTLLEKKNYIKLYENWFGQAEYNNRLENGLRWKVNATYEDRIPLVNTTDFSFFKKSSNLLPNHPYELSHIAFNRHQALTTSLTLSFQPGQRYIEFPTYKVPVGSRYPTLELQYTKGINGLAGSDIDFDKWKFTVFDAVNLKLGGELHYRLGVGGFLNRDSVGLPDFTHFIGNQTIFRSRYLNSFQLAPYYQYSNTERFYAIAHLEHHFNGLLTNKIPLFNRLKWHLVAGTNTFYVNRQNYYAEAFVGLENILKILRIDFVTAYQSQPGSSFGVRIGMGGIIGGAISNSR